MIRCSLQALDRANTNLFSCPLLAPLTTLSFSKNLDLQRRAALVFAEITEKGTRYAEPKTLDPILRLLDNCDAGVQEAACIALKNLAVNGGYFRCSVTSGSDPFSPDENRPLIVNLGGLRVLARLMLSPAVGVQCHASGCVLALARHGANEK